MPVKQSTRRKKTPGITPELQEAMEYFKEKDNLLSPPITRAARKAAMDTQSLPFEELRWRRDRI
jgi:hypothetical protein